MLLCTETKNTNRLLNGDKPHKRKSCFEIKYKSPCFTDTNSKFVKQGDFVYIMKATGLREESRNVL